MQEVCQESVLRLLKTSETGRRFAPSQLRAPPYQADTKSQFKLHRYLHLSIYLFICLLIDVKKLPIIYHLEDFKGEKICVCALEYSSSCATATGEKVLLTSARFQLLLI